MWKSIALPIVVSLACLPACTDEPAESHLRTKGIADLVQPRLWIDYEQVIGKPPQVIVSLYFMTDGATLPLHDGDFWYCPTLDIEGDFGGHALDLVDSGGIYHVMGDPRCRAPRFELDLPSDGAPATTRVSVRDSSGELAFDLGDVQLPRTFAATDHPDWTFGLSEKVSITVTPTLLPGSSIQFSAAWGEQLLQTTTEGGLHLYAPGAYGSGTLWLNVRSYSDCGSACTLVAMFVTEVPATVAP